MFSVLLMTLTLVHMHAVVQTPDEMYPDIEVQSSQSRAVISCSTSKDDWWKLSLPKESNLQARRSSFRKWKSLLSELVRHHGHATRCVTHRVPRHSA